MTKRKPTKPAETAEAGTAEPADVGEAGVELVTVWPAGPDDLPALAARLLAAAEHPGQVRISTAGPVTALVVPAALAADAGLAGDRGPHEHETPPPTVSQGTASAPSSPEPEPANEEDS